MLIYGKDGRNCKINGNEAIDSMFFFSIKTICFLKGVHCDRVLFSQISRLAVKSDNVLLCVRYVKFTFFAMDVCVCGETTCFLRIEESVFVAGDIFLFEKRKESKTNVSKERFSIKFNVL